MECLIVEGYALDGHTIPALIRAIGSRREIPAGAAYMKHEMRRSFLNLEDPVPRTRNRTLCRAWKRGGYSEKKTTNGTHLAGSSSTEAGSPSGTPTLLAAACFDAAHSGVFDGL